MSRMNDPELRMSLMEHLEELRSRLLKITVAVLVLGVVSLVFARPIFGILMKPVLEALPVEGRALVYTSGIEEINVLMKVGLYCGLFLTTPVILWQLWAFVSPGLYPHERRYAAPFILFGSVAFITGALFCYFVLLPSMFQFLLQSGDSGPLADRLEVARLREAEVIRYVRLGELDEAGELAKKASGELRAAGDGQVEASDVLAPGKVEAMGRLDAMGRFLDAAGEGVGLSGRPVLRNVMEKRVEAVEAFSKNDFRACAQALDESSALLAGVAPVHASQLNDVWRLERDLAAGKSRYEAAAWTRPMLTMSEQLSLVLLLELAFGVIFELPLVMALLAVVGLVKSRWLMKYQRHAFVVCLIAAAVITPTGDAVNLALMAVPMLLCFELGVLAVWLIEKRRAKESASTAITPAS